PTRTDAKGTYSVSIENGSGMYMVAVQMLGNAPQRRVVTRPVDGSPIPAQDFKMTPVAAQLGAVRSVGERPRVMRSDIAGESSIGGQTTFTAAANGLTGNLTGDLTAALTTLPGLTVTPSATGGLPSVSAFGIPDAQNGLVLNNMLFGATVPRDGVRLSVVTASYDPGRGGFAGVQ